MNIPDFDSLAPPSHREIYSLGYCCQFLQILPGQLKVLMEDSGVSFDSSVDGVPYLRADQLQQCIDAYKRITAEIEAVANSTANN